MEDLNSTVTNVHSVGSTTPFTSKEGLTRSTSFVLVLCLAHFLHQEKKLQKKLEKPPSKFPTSIYGYLLPLHSQENPQRPFSAPRPFLASPPPFAHLPVNLASSASLVCRSNVTHPNNLIRQERLFAASSTTLILRTVQVPSHDPSSDS